MQYTCAMLSSVACPVVECVWNVMAHAQKPDFVFRRNGRVHLYRRGCQFSRLLAAEVCASALVMLDTSRSEVGCVCVYWLPTPFASFPFTFPPVCHRVPSDFKRTLQHFFTLSHKRQNFRKTLLDIKRVFWCSLQLSHETFLILRRTERDMVKEV
jgi:hypothetical protein